MRIPYLGLFIILLVNIGVDWYIFRFLQTEVRKRIWSKIQFCSAVVFTLGLIALFFVPLKSMSDAGIRRMMWYIFVYITVYLPKYIFVVFDFIARLPRFWDKRPLAPVTWTGVTLGVILFVSLWYGAIFNRFNLDVKKVEVKVAGLPEAFDNFKIVQISDLHVGTFGTDTTFLNTLVNKVNDLEPDLIVFTGDIVNRRTTELEPFTGVLSRLDAKYGVYSILGNHDYGDYYQWNDSTDRDLNNIEMEKLQADMGWKLLKNDYADIVVKGDTLVLIGVENIGDPPFHVYGDLKKSYPTPGDDKLKILLSHNPAHWVTDIADNPANNIALTLSGHTHAMQTTVFGWSPASFRYNTWGGLYSDTSGKRQLYVNIGAGTVGFPARIGATPEITLITLCAD